MKRVVVWIEGEDGELSKPILVVTYRLTDAVEERIARDFVSRYPQADTFTTEELLAAAEGADALLVTSVNKLGASFFERVPSSVKVIATFSVGYEHIDLAAAAARKIPISNTPGVLTDATADIAMLLLLGASRRASEGQELMRADKWKGFRPTDLLGWQLTGKVMGIYGMGRIGQAVAQRARAFGMKIHYCNRSRLAAEIEGDAVFHESPQELLGVSQFLSVHAPSTPETRHFLNAQTLALLPKGVVVVNTARGGLVNDDDLIAALKMGQVAAAGLDVFEGEPNIHPGYKELPNVFLLPHLGSATVETRTAMGMLALDNIDAVLAGRKAPTLVNAG
jgi:lactate dehydrogenase-like 2-hydroxyacid dehydrogenase